MNSGKQMEPPVATITRSCKIYAGECDDWSGYIYMPAPFHLMSIGDQELFEQLGQPLWKLMEQGYSIPIVHAECDFLSPAKVGAVLTQRGSLHLGRNTSFVVEHEFKDESGKAVLRGKTIRVWASMPDMTALPLPAWLRDLQRR